MADKCIGNLTLNTKGVEDSVKKVNELLESLGVGKKINISSRVTAAVKESLKDVEKLLADSEKKIADTAEKAAAAISNIGKKKIGDATEIEKTVAALKEYYNWMTKVEQAKQQGNKANEALYGQKASEALAQVNNDLRTQAEAYSSVTKAITAYEAAKNNTAAKAAAEDARTAAKAAADEAKETEKATQAYIKLEEAKSRMRLAQDQYGKESVEYAKAAEAVQKLQTAFDSYSKTAKEAAGSSHEVSSALDNIAKAENAMQAAVSKKEAEAQIVNNIKQKYIELTDAIQRYNAEKKAGNELGMSTEQAKIDAVMEEVGIIQQVVASTQMEANAKQQVKNIIDQCVTAETKHNAEIQSNVRSTGELDSAVNSIVTRYLSLFAVIRTINSLVNNMVDYVSEYADKMNEIQMITLSSNEEVAKLGETYRNIAKDMSVSSLDMAEAAVYFTRQGLEAADIEDRLKNVTMYAKAANVEFKDASEIITAVINSMNLVEQEAEDGRTAAQRVADVFLAIGDNAATSGQEIGEAMQKAAASAGSFGVSMEWLASYIATVSETTRQEARTIGTAFNTIIARLHQIKQTGYNQEDETKINDIAKALSKIDVALLNQDGSWRRMEDILQDVAAEWSDLDDKTKSYIATTMAGVKQQNVFLALMNDMAKGAENGSRAFKLYNEAMNSNGAAAEKYGVYLESVTAAQERLTVAQENFYAILSENVIKSWYDGLANVINFITDATEAMGGLNIILPLIAGGFIIVSAAIKKVNIELAKAGSWLALLQAHPIVGTITVIGGAIAAITAIAGGFAAVTESSEEKLSRLNQTISDSQQRISKYQGQQQGLSNMMQDVGTDTKMTSEQFDKYNDLLMDLSKISPEAATAVDNLKAGIIGQKEAYELINEEIEKYIKNEQVAQALALKEEVKTPKQKSESQRIAEMLLEKKDINAKNGWFTDVYNISEEFGNYWSTLAYGGWSQDQILEQVRYDFLDGLNEAEYLARDLMDKYLEVITRSMNDIDKEAVRSEMARLVLGEDGILDFTEYQNAGNVVQRFLDKAIASMFDPSALVSDRTRLMSLGQQLFGNYFEMFFGNQIDALLQSENASEIINEISDAISELFKAGFNEIDISDILLDVPLEEWVNAISKMRTTLMQSISLFGEAPLYDNNGAEPLFWNQLDLSTLKVIENMIEAGTALENIKQLMRDSKDVDEFKEKLATMGQDAEEGGEEASRSLQELVNDIKSYNTEIGKLEGYIKTLQEGGNLTDSDILGLAMAHPEIATFIDDTDALIEAIQEYKDELSDMKHNSMVDWLRGNEDFWASSSYGKENFDEPFKTFEDYLKSLEVGSDEYNAVTAYLESAATNLQKATESARKAAAEAKETAISKTEDEAFAKKLEEYEKEYKKYTDMLEALDKGKTIDFADLLSISMDDVSILEAASKGIDELRMAIAKLQELSSNGAAATIQESILGNTDLYKNSPFGFISEYSNLGELKNNAGNLGDVFFGVDIEKQVDAFVARTEAAMLAGTDQLKTIGREAIADLMTDILEGAFPDETEFDFDQLDEYINQIAEGDESLAKVLAVLRDAYVEVADAQDTWLQQQAKEIAQQEELNWASTTGYAEQVNELQNALTTGGVESAMNVWNLYDEQMKNSIRTTYPDLITALAEVEAAMAAKSQMIESGTATDEELQQADDDLAQAQSNLARELQTTNEYLDATHFTETANAAKQLREGTISVTEAYAKYNKDLNNVAKAQQEIIKGQANLQKNTKITTNDVQNLASVLGMSTEEVAENFPEAVKLFDELTGATGELKAQLDALNEAAFIRITGTAEADFSEITSGLLIVKSMAQEAVEELLKTGQWELEELELPQEGLAFNPLTGKWHREWATAHAKVLKYKGSPATPTVSGGGGGGGGGGGSEDSYDQKILDEMDKVDKFYKSQLEYFEALEKYYDSAGLTQGVIKSLERQREVLEEENKALGENIDMVKERLDLKKEELSTLAQGSDAYNACASDVEALEDAYRSMSTEQLNNIASTNALTDAIRAQQNAVRDLQIEIQNEIYSAIEDRERRADDMLNGRVDAENMIMDIVKSRYEAERDALLEAAKEESSSSGGGGGGGSSGYEDQIELLREKRDQIKENAKLTLDGLKEEYDAFQKNNKAQQDALKKEFDRISQIYKLRIDSLNEEKSLLNEQLNLRKQQYEMDDKATRLAELEAKYQRIIADPTRRKEALDIQKQIQSLRNEIAWDTAEEEVKSQQQDIDDEVKELNRELGLHKEKYEDQKDALTDALNAYKESYEEQKKLIEDTRDAQVKAIDEQIKALEKLAKAQSASSSSMASSSKSYTEQVKKYYDELFAHPAKLIQETSDILSGTDDEIIEWMKENDEEYKNASAARQEQMEKDWRETLRQMRGEQEDHWEEVEDIMAQGDEAIIQFLMNNSDGYKLAGTLQGQKYIEGWREKLKELGLMLEPVEVMPEIDFGTAPTVNPNQTGGSSSGGGSGGGGGGGGGGANTPTKSGIHAVGTSGENLGANLNYDNGTWYNINPSVNKSDLSVLGGNTKLAHSVLPKLDEEKLGIFQMDKFATGGMADYTGPAWLDGSATMPERILSPYQTELFETMVHALESASRINVQTAPNFENLRTTGSNVSVGDIIVNVDNLDTDDDYEELAEKVGEVLMDRLGRTSVVGGIRIRSI